MGDLFADSSGPEAMTNKYRVDDHSRLQVRLPRLLCLDR